jgi:hypothetical protein
MILIVRGRNSFKKDYLEIFKYPLKNDIFTHTLLKLMIVSETTELFMLPEIPLHTWLT